MLKSSSSAASKSRPVPDRLARRAEHVAEPFELRARLLERLVGVVDRLAPVAGQEEEEQRLAPPAVERVAERDVVAERLRHLLAAELRASRCASRCARTRARAHATARARSRGAGRRGRGRRRGSRTPAPSCFSAIAEHSMCQPGRPRPHGESHARVLARLVRLPEREVARILLERVRLLLLHLVRPLPREPAVLREAARRGNRRRRSTSYA